MFVDRVKKEGGSLSLVCEFDVDSLTSKPPKGKIGWLPQGATPCTVNQYDKLFNECEIAVQVIPTPLHVLGRISPIFSPFFLVFCAFSPSRRDGSNEPHAGTQG